jgi:uncharacterized protein (TIGR03118 family)
MSIATSASPIFAGDANSTSVIYAANFRSGKIEVYDSAFKAVHLTAGAFADSKVPDGFAPFDVQVLNGQVYVSYAKQDAAKHDDVAGQGNGFVDVFNLNGTPGLAGGKVRLVTRGQLDSPWGLAIAPAGFAAIGAPHNDPVLLVGNFGDGSINAFDATTGSFLTQLKDANGKPIQIDGLWALKVGNGGAGGNANTVYFTAGPMDETHGLFGSLSTAAPHPAPVGGTSPGLGGSSSAEGSIAAQPGAAAITRGSVPTGVDGALTNLDLTTVAAALSKGKHVNIAEGHE